MTQKSIDPFQLWERLSMPLALLPGENEGEFDAIARYLHNTYQPLDTFEKLLVSDLTETEWELRRLRTFKMEIARSGEPDAIRQILTPVIGALPAAERAKKLISKDELATRNTEKELASLGVTHDTLNAMAWKLQLEAISQIDRQMAMLAARRSLICRQLDRHEASRARRLERQAKRKAALHGGQATPVSSALEQHQRPAIVSTRS